MERRLRSEIAALRNALRVEPTASSTHSQLSVHNLTLATIGGLNKELDESTLQTIKEELGSLGCIVRCFSLLPRTTSFCLTVWFEPSALPRSTTHLSSCSDDA